MRAVAIPGPGGSVGVKGVAHANCQYSARRSAAQPVDDARLSQTAPCDTAPDRLTERRCAGLIAVAGYAASVGGALGFAAPLGPAAQGLAVAVALGLATLALRTALRRAPGVPVLVYHSVSEQPDWLPWADNISIRPDSLDRHLRLLERMGLTVISDQEFLARRLEGRDTRDTVVLHFDDGYLDTRVAAWPILRRHGACATLFVSTDFIAPDQPHRPTTTCGIPLRWDGYLSWSELRALDATPEFAVEAHGTDHGRVPTGPDCIGRLTADTIGVHAWMQWAEMPGDKHDWYLRDALPVPVGTPLPQSAPSLSARAWLGQRLEHDSEYQERVSECLETSAKSLREHLGRPPQIFCWPQNATNDSARALAQKAGFVATTGGRGRNTRRDDPRVIARLHADQDYAGFRCPWLDDLALRAHLRCFQGDLVWAPVLMGIGGLRRAVKAMKSIQKRGRR